MPPGKWRVAREPIHHQENKGWNQYLRDQGMPDQSGEPTVQRRESAVFADSEAGRVDVRSLVSAVEIVPGGMVLCVVPSPVCVGGKGYQATNPARGIVGGAGG